VAPIIDSAAHARDETEQLLFEVSKPRSAPSGTWMYTRLLDRARAAAQIKKARRLGRRAFTTGQLRYFFFFFAAAFFFAGAFLATAFFFAAFLAAGMLASRTVYGRLRQRPPPAISQPQPMVSNLVEKHKM
jgi:hypothetical protein